MAGDSQAESSYPSLSSDQTSGQRNNLGIFRSQGSGVTISIVEIPFVVHNFLMERTRENKSTNDTSLIALVVIGRVRKLGWQSWF